MRVRDDTHEYITNTYTSPEFSLCIYLRSRSQLLFCNLIQSEAVDDSWGF